MTKQNDPAATRKALLLLSRELGRPEHRWTILGEGNTSAVLDADTFLVKASGTELRTLQDDHLVQVRFDKILPLLDRRLDQEATREALLAARVDPTALKPSVETAFHAWLLGQEGVRYVGHTHPEEVNKVLCSGHAATFAERRLFPDEVVCCGPKSLLVEYVDPGAALAAAIRQGWQRFVADNGWPPRLILLRNHGLIAVGATPAAVLATTFMAVKAAAIYVGAAALGGPVFMEPKDVAHIHNRQDEHYRQRQLHLRP